MATEYVIRNTQNRPDRSGVVRPFLTRMFDGRQYAVVVTDAELEGDGVAWRARPSPRRA
jgi:hypothetical protein